MKLEHRVVRMREFIEQTEEKGTIEDDKYLFLNSGNTLEEQIVSQAISLDIRGNYGVFINRINPNFPIRFARKKRDFQKAIIWKGNIFSVKQDVKNVCITNLLDEEAREQITIPLPEWIDALQDWKEFYLTELGFKEFTSKQLSHVLGILIMTKDQMENSEDFAEEYVRQAISDCSERYGLAKSTLYTECKRVIDVNTILDFYDWARDVLTGRGNCSRTDEMKNKFIGEKNIELSFENYLGVRI